MSLDGEIPDQRVVEASANARESRIMPPERKASDAADPLAGTLFERRREKSLGRGTRWT